MIARVNVNFQFYSLFVLVRRQRRAQCACRCSGRDQAACSHSERDTQCVGYALESNVHGEHCTGPCMKQISSGVLHAHAWQSQTESHCSYNRTCMVSLQEVNCYMHGEVSMRCKQSNVLQVEVAVTRSQQTNGMSRNGIM